MGMVIVYETWASKKCLRHQNFMKEGFKNGNVVGRVD